MSEATDYWAVVIGSGFGGSVIACRLAQALEYKRRNGKTLEGKICLLERGRRYDRNDFPRLRLPDYLTEDSNLRTSRRLPDASRMLWGIDQGLFDVRGLGQLLIVQSAGFGGGSLIYANVHLKPPESIFRKWPTQYRNLDAEFQRVAEWLEVNELPDEWKKSIPKTKLMEKVANKLERELFHPPLAINFDAAGTNRYGKLQGQCNGCGNCVIGCQEAAKNTLDLNYLAVAEAFGIEVRTLSEVRHLENARASQNGKSRYRIVYFDHLDQREKVVDAKFVFLAAGAVGTTELLLRSLDRKRSASQAKAAALTLDKLDETGKTGVEMIGHGFFANGDSLSVAFDTLEVASPSHGPTITTALLHAESMENEKPEPRQPYRESPRWEPAGQAKPLIDQDYTKQDKPMTWMLIEDGGIPASFERVLGMFRSPIWMGRNRLTKAADRSDVAALLAKPATLADQGIADVAFTAATLASYVRGRPELGPSSPIGFPTRWFEVLPKSARTGAEWLADISNRAREETRRLNERVLEKEGPDTLFLSRWAVDRGRLLEHVADALSELFPLFKHLLRERHGFDLIVELVTYALMSGPASPRTMVFLAMGPDQQGKLERDRFGKLRVEFDEGTNVELFGLQERLMRDLAVELGGELRANPNWTLGRRAVTVHAQGGCAMDVVTDLDGRVYGSEGLYVVDAAAFPSSVGVNPASTVAAVAERKAALFIAKNLSDAPSIDEVVGTLPHENVRAARTQGAKNLTISKNTYPIKSPPNNLEWKERLEGWLSEAPADLDEQDLEAFAECERRGQQNGERIVLDASVTIPDLDLFIRTLRSKPACPDFLRASLRGRLHLSDTNQTPGLSIAECSESYLEFKIAQRAGVQTLQLAPNALEGLSYRFWAGTAPNHVVLVGEKYFHDDPGQDVWPDLTTLYFRLYDKSAPKHRAGILRAPVSQFLDYQLPSFKVGTGDADSRYAADEATQLWGLARFAAIFFGGIYNVYDRWF